MDSSPRTFLKLSGGAGVTGLALLGYGINFASNRQNYDLATSPWAIASYACFLVAVVLFLLCFERVRRVRPFSWLWPISSGLGAQFDYTMQYLVIRSR